MKTETVSVRVETVLLERAREHCFKNGIKLTWFVSRAIEKELEDKKKVNNK